MPSNTSIKYGGVYNNDNTNDPFMEGNKNTDVRITLKFEDDEIQFPINPEAIKVNGDSASQSLDVIGLGTVSIPTTPKPLTMSINSFIWHDATDKDFSFSTDKNYYARTIITKLGNWQANRKPAMITIQGLFETFPITWMYVICDKFNYETRAGEEDCIYFELSLRQYKMYGAEKVDVDTDNLTANIYESTPSRIDNREAHTEVIASDTANTSNPTTVALTEEQDPVEVAAENLDSIDVEEAEFADGAVITIPEPEGTDASTTIKDTTQAPSLSATTSLVGTSLEGAVKDNTVLGARHWWDLIGALF